MKTWMTYKRFLNLLSLYTETRFLNTVYKTFIHGNDRVDHIMNLKVDNRFKGLLNERNLPCSMEFVKSGWWKFMLLRYGVAMKFCKEKDVLETCSGLGWGAYLLDSVASSVTCIEMDERSINLSKQIWNTDRTSYVRASVLEVPIKNDTYDVVTAMESIEHFKLEDIEIYLSEIYRVLKRNGILTGSSSFPETAEEANDLCSKNKYHLHICTCQEIQELLKRQGFRKIRIFGNRLFFVATK